MSLSLAPLSSLERTQNAVREGTTVLACWRFDQEHTVWQIVEVVLHPLLTATLDASFLRKIDSTLLYVFVQRTQDYIHVHPIDGEEGWYVLVTTTRYLLDACEFLAQRCANSPLLTSYTATAA